MLLVVSSELNVMFVVLASVLVLALFLSSYSFGIVLSGAVGLSVSWRYSPLVISADTLALA